MGVGPGGGEPAQVEPTTKTGNESKPGVVETPSEEPSAQETQTEKSKPLGAGAVGQGNKGRSKAPTVPMRNAPKYMYRGVGGPLPKTAGTATNFKEGPDGQRYAVVSSPSDNIVCQISTVEDASCMIFKTSFGLEKDPSGKWKNEIPISGDTAPALGVPSKDPAWFEGGVEPQPLAYGKQVHYGGVVCASERKGMTCWDVTTGHGAFLSKDRVEGF